MKKQRIVYQSTYFDTKEDMADSFSAYIEYLRDTDRESEIPGMTDNCQSFIDWHEENNSDWYSCEKENLNVDLGVDIIAIADLGLWNGRRLGYKRLGSNLNEILTFFGCDYVKIFAEERNIKSLAIHHDGTHCVRFRKWKDDTTEAQRERVLEAIYNQSDAAQALISRFTCSIYSDVKEIFGW